MEPLDLERYQQARLSRDARFDGQFFIAVKTTGIFCRPVCPASPPKEANVEYFQHATQAMAAGFRPCLRCRPDSAPKSWAWRGAETSFQRAITLIDEGALQTQSLAVLAERLGISDRYLRQLFDRYLGLSPKRYAQYQQLLFAKQLLHQSALPIAEVALASGFQSVRRFNDACLKTLQLTPSDIRKQGKPRSNTDMSLLLSFRGPLNFQAMLEFYRMRSVAGVEEIGNDFYARTGWLLDAPVWFALQPAGDQQLKLTFDVSNARQLPSLVAWVRQLWDLDTDLDLIQQHLKACGLFPEKTSGLRLPGAGSPWQAGVRAILGQQVSVKAAIGHLNLLVEHLGNQTTIGGKERKLFPTPSTVAKADLSFLKMPNARRETLRNLAIALTERPDLPYEQWLSLKGIGPWTVDYVALRGACEPDRLLTTDLIVRKALETRPDINISSLSPWGSYATLHCWEGNL